MIQSQSRAKTVLCIDDDPSLRGSIVQHLASEGYEVLEAWNADQALKMIETFSGTFQAVVTDYNMPPGKTGANVILEADALGRKVERFILMSGHLESNPDIRAALSGKTIAPVFFLPKPFQIRELFRLLTGKSEDSNTTKVNDRSSEQ